MPIMSGQANLVRSGEFRFGQVVLAVPDTSSGSGQFRSSQVGSGGSVQHRSGGSEHVKPVRSV